MVPPESGGPGEATRHLRRCALGANAEPEPPRRPSGRRGGSEPELQVGPRVRELERRVAALFDKKHGIRTNSGTSALYLAVELLGLPPGSEIITSVVSFSATFAPIVRGGFVASYVDVGFDTYTSTCTRSRR